MRVAILGATGRSGRAATTHALGAGHEVTAVVRDPARAPDGAQVAVADAKDPDSLTAALGEADAVISCIGQVAADGDVHVLERSAQALVAALERVGTRRVIAVSAAAAYVAGDDPLSRFIAKPILERVLAENNADTRSMENVFRAGSLDWTLLRPGRLVPGKGRDPYRWRLDRSVWWHWSTRFDTVGRAAVDALERPEWIGHAVFITN